MEASTPVLNLLLLGDVQIGVEKMVYRMAQQESGPLPGSCFGTDTVS
jgi:hypothetical protein